MTIRYHEDEEVRRKTALAPLPCYAGFPMDGVGKVYDRLRREMSMTMPEDVLQWEKGDWAVGIPHTLNDKETYQILKEYETRVIEGNIKDGYTERCD